MHFTIGLLVHADPCHGLMYPHISTETYEKIPNQTEKELIVLLYFCSRVAGFQLFLEKY